MNSAKNMTPRYTYLQTSASGLVKTGSGMISAVVVSSATAGTITIYDNTTASGNKILDVMTIVAGTRYVLDAQFLTGCYIVIGGTASLTVLYQ